jgi:hypothetical protein
MVKTGRVHAVHLALLLCILLASGSVGAIAATSASAGPLEGASGPVGQVVAPAEELTGTVTAPVKGATETVAPPVQGATESVSPPVQEATRPVQEVTEAVAPAGKEATEKATPPVKEVTEPIDPPTRQVTEKAASSPVKAPVGAAANTATNVIGTSPVGATRDAEIAAHDSTAGANHASPETVDSRKSPVSTAPGLGPDHDTFEAPSPDGAVRAPLPKWVAYVWPAIALTGHAAANLVDYLEHDGLRLMIGTVVGLEAAAGVGPVVAGVHASGGRPEASDSSSSPFPRIAYELGHFPSDGPGWVLTFLILAATLGAAAFAARRWESSHHHRQGPGQ